MPVRTFGGAGGGSTVPSTVTAAQVVWGPNFGEPNELNAEGHLVVSSFTAVATPQMTEEETFSRLQYQGAYPMTMEGTVTRDISLAYVKNLTEEADVVRAIQQPTYQLAEEADFISGAQVPVFASTGEMVLRLAQQQGTWSLREEGLVDISQYQFTFFRPTEEATITGTITMVFSSSGSFTVPAGTTKGRTEVFAPGGNGGNGNALAPFGGGGGGGGGYSLATATTFTAGTTVTVTVGTSAGLDSWIRSSAAVLAKPGVSGANGSAVSGGAGGAGGSSAAGVGNVKFSGGAGSSGSGQGGGGGGGAGTSASGGNAVSTAGGAGGVAEGGDGGDGGNAVGGNGSIGQEFGGGAGGGGGTGGIGAAGARGGARVTFALV